MAIFSLQRGAEVCIGGRHYKLQRLIGDTLWQLEDAATGRIESFGIDQLLGMYRSGALLPFKASSNGTTPPKIAAQDDSAKLLLPPEQLELAKVRRLYAEAVLPIPNSAPLIKAAIQEVWKKHRSPATPPGWISVWRWKKRYLEAGKNFLALLENRSARGNRTERYPSEVRRVVEDAIELKYMQLTRGTIEDTLNHAQALINRENKLRPQSARLPLPTRRYIKRLIDEIPAYDQCVARLGRDIADNRFRAVLKERFAKAPLAVAVIDHTLLNMIVVDDETLMPLGRPYLTVILDDRTRMVLGLCISFEPPSFLTVAQALKHAILPKTDLKELFPEVENDWPAYGLMSVLLVDNGMEFHSTDLENACYALGIDIQYCPRKRSWLKGKIERLLGTLNREISIGTPGTTFANILEKADYDPVKTAVLRYSTLKSVIHRWVADVYHQRKHRTLGKPPIVAWREEIRSDEILLAEDPKLLDIALGTSAIRRLTHKGVELNSLRYNSPELLEIRQRYGGELKVQIRFNSADLGHIFVVHPRAARTITVRCLSFEYANGLSLFQHKICKRFADKYHDRYDATAWLEAKLKIGQTIQAELGIRRRKTHTKAARFLNIDVVPSGDPENRTQSVVTQLSSPLHLQLHSAPSEADLRASAFQPIMGEVPRTRIAPQFISRRKPLIVDPTSSTLVQPQRSIEND